MLARKILMYILVFCFFFKKTNQPLLLGEVYISGLMDSNSNKNLIESAKGVIPSFSPVSVVAKGGR